MSDKFICGYRRVRMDGVSDAPRDEYRLEGAGCSYCGSVSQEAFLAFVEAGGEVGPTDKNYKVYLHGDNAPGGKFYFYHLNKAGVERFIELYNAQKIKFGFPGHLYVLPYFARMTNVQSDS